MKNYKDRASVNFLLFVRFITYSSPVDIVRLRESRDLRNVEHDQLNIDLHIGMAHHVTFIFILSALSAVCNIIYTYHI